MFKYSLHTDRNGNRTIRITPKNGKKGFSIQTNGNLPEVHREAMKTRNGKFIPDALMIQEILHYVALYGTDRQRELMPKPISPIFNLTTKQ